tara:strand:+ start:229 stop:363 length:135 start_codon:yes stop_codon:yes gene_type:complete
MAIKIHFYMLKKIIYKLKSKKFSVCVIGLGYVGLPLISLNVLKN